MKKFIPTILIVSVILGIIVFIFNRTINFDATPYAFGVLLAIIIYFLIKNKNN